MTFPVNAPNGRSTAHDSEALVGRDPILLQDGASARRGYTSEAAWSPDMLQGAPTSPPILFEGSEHPETVDLKTARAFFVRSLETEAQGEPIHFHDNLPHAELLWVRLVLEDDEQFEGMMSNSAGLILDQFLVLIPTDPQTNTRKILFSREQVREFHVLGVRAG